MKRPLAFTAVCFFWLVACGSDEGGGAVANPCTINAGSDDCQGRGTTTVKYDCASVDDRKKAEGLGCVPQDPKDDTDRDVCCAPQAAPSGPVAGGKSVPCSTKKGDDDCADRAGFAKKFDCDDRDARDEAVAAGCVLENKDKPDSNDVCCPDSYTAR